MALAGDKDFNPSKAQVFNSTTFHGVFDSRLQRAEEGGFLPTVGNFYRSFIIITFIYSIRLDWIGLDWIGLDWIGLDRD